MTGSRGGRVRGSNSPPPELDRFLGALLGGALGDALGFPLEGQMPPYHADPQDCPLTFRHHAIISDDTQLTLVVGQCLVDRGWLDPVDLADRLVRWLPVGRGKGRATTTAVVKLARGVPWTDAGSFSAGNGAAMRVAPIGLMRWNRPVLRWTEAVLSALPTHHDAMAAASAVIMAEAVAELVVHPPGVIDPHAFLDAIVRPARGLERPQPERRNPRVVTTLVDRVVEVEEHLSDTPERAVRDYFYSGAYVLESLPTALWCFLRHPADPDAALREALAVSVDADTVAALVGTLAGALNGVLALPAHLVKELESRDDLETLAERLWHRAAADGYGPSRL